MASHETLLYGHKQLAYPVTIRMPENMIKIKVFIFAFIFSCVSLAQANELLELLKPGKSENEIYNEINNAELTKENLNLLLALWRGERGKYPGVPWELVSSDIVRISVANVLMQAKRQCRVEIDMNELHEFILLCSKSDDLKVKGRATFFLGMAGYESDIPFLSSIVLQEKEGYAEEAAMSITFIHSKAALYALEDLREKVHRESLQIFLDNILAKYKKYNLKEYSKSCDNK